MQQTGFRNPRMHAAVVADAAFDESVVSIEEGFHGYDEALLDMLSRNEMLLNEIAMEQMPVEALDLEETDRHATEIVEVMAMEMQRFDACTASSVGGIPVEYADHLTHFRKRTMREPKMLRMVMVDDDYLGQVGFGRLPAHQPLPRR